MKIRSLTGKTKSFEQQQQRKHPTSQEPQPQQQPPSLSSSSSSSSLLFYWNRPIGAPSTLIRLTISERQCKQSNTLRQVHDTSSCSIQNIISCWALPITSIQQLIYEIRKSTNYNNNNSYYDKIDTLEICFNNAITSFLVLSKEKEKDDIWNSIANELVNCCGNTIHTIQFIYHHQHHSSTSSSSSSSSSSPTVSRSYNIATSNGNKIPIVIRNENIGNENDNICIEQYIYHCTSIILHAFANYIRKIHFNFMVPYDINTNTTTSTNNSSTTSTGSSDNNDPLSTKVQSVKMKTLVGQQVQSKQSNVHSNNNSSNSNSSNLFYSKLWNCLQHCIKLQELCISNGPCIIESYHDDIDTNELLLQNSILPRLYQLKLHNMYISKHVWDTYLLSCIEMNNIIPIFENITFVNNTGTIKDNNDNTTTIQLSYNNSNNNNITSNRHGSNNDDISSLLSNMNLSSCKTVLQQEQPSTLSNSSLSNYNEMCRTNTKQQRKLMIDDNEYIQWLQLLHQWRYNIIEKYCPTSIIQQQSQYSLQQIYSTYYYSTKKSSFNNINNSTSITTQHTIKTRKLIDTVVIIIRDWYKS